MQEFPRSLIFAAMAEFSRTLFADRSLWIIGELRLWRYTSPLDTSASMDLLRVSGMSGVFSSRSSRLIRSFSIIRTGREESGRKHTPMNCTTCGCLRSDISWHSSTYFLTIFCTPTLPASISDSWILLPAHIRPLISNSSTLP